MFFTCALKNLQRFTKTVLAYKRNVHITSGHLSSTASKAKDISSKYTDLIEFHGTWPENERDDFIRDMRILQDFINADEEAKLFEEIEPYIKRMRYETAHWDDAIHKFRETERKHWYPHNKQVIERIRSIAFKGEIMPYVHVLDLAEDGVIKPHVDSTRYCGTTISGISLLSNAVMRLVRTDEKKYQQGTESDQGREDDAYRSQPITSLEGNFYADILLNRRSLYIMSHSARYKFTHEILSNENSMFNGKPVKKGRRISIICRNEP